MSLTKEQLKRIDQYLKRKGIDFWDVRYEFVDHIACILEEKIAQDISFEKAFKEIEKDFSRPILKKQQKRIQKNLNKKSICNALKAFKCSWINYANAFCYRKLFSKF